MKIVIDIPEKVYEAYKYWNSQRVATIEQMLIVHGTVLPKGHGDLIDRDELKKHKYHDNNRYENAVSIAQVDWAKTIIEADKEADNDSTAE